MAKKKKNEKKRKAASAATEASSNKLEQRIGTLEKLSVKLNSQSKLAEKDRIRLAKMYVDALGLAQETGNEKQLDRVFAAFSPHLAKTLFDLNDERSWWETWNNKRQWLQDEYRKCRRRYSSSARRKACYALRSAEMALCAGSNGPEGGGTASPAAWIPMETLEAASISVAGLDHLFGMVPFVRSKDSVSLAELKKQTDVKFWLRMRKERLAQASSVASEIEAFDKLSAITEKFIGKYRGKDKISQDLQREMLTEEIRANHAELAQRQGAAIQNMRSMGLVNFEGYSYLVSTFNPAQPEIILEIPPAGTSLNVSERDALDEAAFWVELVLEAVIGLLSLLGVHFPRSANKLARWVGRLMRRVNANRRLRMALLRFIRAQGTSGFSVVNLIQLLCLFIEHDALDRDFMQDFLEDMADLGHWGILRILLKLGARATPGVGAALVAADLALIIVEIVVKIDRYNHSGNSTA